MINDFLRRCFVRVVNAFVLYQERKAGRKCPERKRIMMTVNFAYDLYIERNSKALFIEKEQSLDFMRSYKVKRRKLRDID